MAFKSGKVNSFLRLLYFILFMTNVFSKFFTLSIQIIYILRSLSEYSVSARIVFIAVQAKDFSIYELFYFTLHIFSTSSGTAKVLFPFVCWEGRWFIFKLMLIDNIYDLCCNFRRSFMVNKFKCFFSWHVNSTIINDSTKKKLFWYCVSEPSTAASRLEHSICMILWYCGMGGFMPKAVLGDHDSSSSSLDDICEWEDSAFELFIWIVSLCIAACCLMEGEIIFRRTCRVIETYSMETKMWATVRTWAIDRWWCSQGPRVFLFMNHW